MRSNIWIESWVDWLYLEMFFYMTDMLGAWIMELFFYTFKLIMATCYPIKTKKIYRYNNMNNCLVDVYNT